jgi:hypothetical protein
MPKVIPPLSLSSKVITGDLGAKRHERRRFHSLVIVDGLVVSISWSHGNHGRGAAGALLSGLEGLLVFTELGHGVDRLVTSELSQGADGPRANSKTDSSHVHAEGQRSSGEEDSEPSITNHDHLNVKLAEEDDPEPEVVEWTSEDVEVWLVLHAGLLDGALLNLSSDGHSIEDTAVDHVEQVHHNEHLEEEGLMEHSVAGGTVSILHLGAVEVVLDVADLGSEVGKHEHANQLVDELEHDLAGHSLGDDLVLGRDASGLECLGIGVLGGESNGSKNIHDQVDPEELHDVEGRVTKENGCGDNVDHASDVDGDLVLDKLADVVLNVTAPFDGSDNSHEVVVHKDDISVVLGGGAAILTHGETDVGFAKGAGIAKTFTSDGDGSLDSSKSAGEHVLELWAGSVDNHDGLLDVFLEALHALSDLEVE